MKRKRRITDQKQQQKTAKKISRDSFFSGKTLVIFLLISILLNSLLLWRIFSPPSSMELLVSAASRASYRVVSPLVLRDPENPSYRIRLADLWDQKTHRVGGYVALFPLRGFPDVALIVDPEGKVVSMNIVSDLRLGGSRIDLGSYFSKLYGLGLESLAGNSGIFSSSDPVLARFTDQFRGNFLKTMQMIFIRARGRAEFERVFPQGIHSASSGDQLRTFQAIDTEGALIGLRDLRQRQTIIITVDNSCGACEVKCSIIRDIAHDYGLQVVFITTGDDQRTQTFIDKYVRNERVVQDTDRSIARSLYMGDPPSIMLIERDLTILHKGFVNNVSEDAEPYFKLFKR